MVNVAVLPLRFTVPPGKMTLLSSKDTVPVGVPMEGTPATVALSVTDCPRLTADADRLSVVVGTDWMTVREKVRLAVAPAASVAVTVKEKGLPLADVGVP